jgi:predicted tellurium resistance membrane protein TerC
VKPGGVINRKEPNISLWSWISIAKYAHQFTWRTKFWCLTMSVTFWLLWSPLTAIEIICAKMFLNMKLNTFLMELKMCVCARAHACVRVCSHKFYTTYTKNTQCSNNQFTALICILLQDAVSSLDSVALNGGISERILI